MLETGVLDTDAVASGEDDAAPVTLVLPDVDADTDAVSNAEVVALAPAVIDNDAHGDGDDVEMCVRLGEPESDGVVVSL